MKGGTNASLPTLNSVLFFGGTQEWTKHHESHTGPVVHLHASVSPNTKAEGGRPQWLWLGSIALQDEIQEETNVAIEYLRRCLGFKLFICTGDNPRTAARVAAALNLPSSCVRAQQTPADKAVFLRSLKEQRGSSEQTVVSDVQQEGKKDMPVCCMVGDGLNDCPALAEAALGVAFGVGQAMPLAAADVAVGGNSWTEMVDLFLIARKMRRIIQWSVPRALVPRAVNHFIFFTLMLNSKRDRTLPCQEDVLPATTFS